MKGKGIVSLVTIILLIAISILSPSAGENAISPVPTHSLNIGNPRKCAIDDINGDGLNDIIVMNLNPQNIMIFLNDETNPDLFQNNPDIQIPTFMFCLNMETGDFNNDGLKDIVLTHVSSGDTGAVIYYQENGTNEISFRSEDLFVEERPFDLDVGDLNNDGLDDVAVVNGWDDTVYIFYQYRGDIPRARDEDFDANDTPTEIEIGDFNGDGLNDILIAHWNGREANIHYQDQRGGFDTEPDHAIDLFRTSSASYFVAVDDLNDDGFDDVIFKNNIYLQVNNQLSYSPSFTLSMEGHPATGDLNFDGLIDIVIWDQNNIYIHYQTSNNTFNREPDVGRTIVDMEYCAIGDLNNDTLQDMIIIQSNTNEVELHYQEIDSDGDFYPDFIDAFPTDPGEWLDSDSDGYGDNEDAFPFDSSRWEVESELDLKTIALLILIILPFILIILPLFVFQRKYKKSQIEDSASNDEKAEEGPQE